VEVVLGVAAVLAEPGVAAQAGLEERAAEQAPGQEDLEVVPVEEVERERAQAAVMGLEQALVRLQGQASDRVLPLRSALVQMRPSALALAHQLVRVRLAGLGLVPVPVRPSVQVPAVRSGKEPVMAQLTGLGTKGSDLKTEPALERPSKDTDSAQVSAATGAGSTCPSLSWMRSRLLIVRTAVS
jgi:hypothetical protein